MTLNPTNPEPGIYLATKETDYRGSDAVSQSLLKEFGEYATPLHFQAREPKKATADMEFGTVCHAAILTPELLHEAYYERPETYPAVVKGEKVNKPWSGNSDWCKEWLENHSDRPVLTKTQVAKIPHIRERVLRLKEFGSALEAGQVEVAHYKRDEETGLMLKCRCDLEASDENDATWVFDLKKVQAGYATEDEFSKQAYNLGYDIQAASYMDITGASRFVFVAFDDDKPFDAMQWEPDADFIHEGSRRWRKLLRKYAECVKNNDWPGYPNELRRIGLPGWVKGD